MARLKPSITKLVRKATGKGKAKPPVVSRRNDDDDDYGRGGSGTGGAPASTPSLTTRTWRETKNENRRGGYVRPRAATLPGADDDADFDNDPNRRPVQITPRTTSRPTARIPVVPQADDDDFGRGGSGTGGHRGTPIPITKRTWEETKHEDRRGGGNLQPRPPVIRPSVAPTSWKPTPVPATADVPLTERRKMGSRAAVTEAIREDLTPGELQARFGGRRTTEGRPVIQAVEEAKVATQQKQDVENLIWKAAQERGIDVNDDDFDLSAADTLKLIQAKDNRDIARAENRIMEAAQARGIDVNDDDFDLSTSETLDLIRLKDEKANEPYRNLQQDFEDANWDPGVAADLGQRGYITRTAKDQEAVNRMIRLARAQQEFQDSDAADAVGLSQQVAYGIQADTNRRFEADIESLTNKVDALNNAGRPDLAAKVRMSELGRLRLKYGEDTPHGKALEQSMIAPRQLLAEMSYDEQGNFDPVKYVIHAPLLTGEEASPRIQQMATAQAEGDVVRAWQQVEKELATNPRDRPGFNRDTYNPNQYYRGSDPFIRGGFGPSWAGLSVGEDDYEYIGPLKVRKNLEPEVKAAIQNFVDVSGDYRLLQQEQGQTPYLERRGTLTDLFDNENPVFTFLDKQRSANLPLLGQTDLGSVTDIALPGVSAFALDRAVNRDGIMTADELAIHRDRFGKEAIWTAALPFQVVGAGALTQGGIRTTRAAVQQVAKLLADDYALTIPQVVRGTATAGSNVIRATPGEAVEGAAEYGLDTLIEGDASARTELVHSLGSAGAEGLLLPGKGRFSVNTGNIQQWYGDQKIISSPAYAAAELKLRNDLNTALTEAVNLPPAQQAQVVAAAQAKYASELDALKYAFYSEPQWQRLQDRAPQGMVPERFVLTPQQMVLLQQAQPDLTVASTELAGRDILAGAGAQMTRGGRTLGVTRYRNPIGLERWRHQDLGMGQADPFRGLTNVPRQTGAYLTEAPPYEGPGITPGSPESGYDVYGIPRVGGGGGWSGGDFGGESYTESLRRSLSGEKPIHPMSYRAQIIRQTGIDPKTNQPVNLGDQGGFSMELEQQGGLAVLESPMESPVFTPSGQIDLGRYGASQVDPAALDVRTIEPEAAVPAPPPSPMSLRSQPVIMAQPGEPERRFGMMVQRSPAPIELPPPQPAATGPELAQAQQNLIQPDAVGPEPDIDREMSLLNELGIGQRPALGVELLNQHRLGQQMDQRAEQALEEKTATETQTQTETRTTTRPEIAAPVETEVTVPTTPTTTTATVPTTGLTVMPETAVQIIPQTGQVIVPQTGTVTVPQQDISTQLEQVPHLELVTPTTPEIGTPPPTDTTTRPETPVDPKRKLARSLDLNRDGITSPKEVEKFPLFPTEVEYVEPATLVRVDLADRRETRQFIDENAKVPLNVTSVDVVPQPGREMIGPHVDVATDYAGQIEERPLRPVTGKVHAPKPAKTKSGYTVRGATQAVRRAPAEIQRFARRARR